MTQTQQLKLSIEEDVLNKYPEMRILGIVVNDLTVFQNSSTTIEGFIEPIFSQIQDKDWGPQQISAEQEIKAWRSAYGEMGVKPSKFKSSFESLFRRVVKNQVPFGVNSIVDAYNAVSLKHRLCMGGYDLDYIEDHIILRYAQEGEKMLPIGTSEPLILNDRSVVYSDPNKVLCSYWNHRDSEETKISTQTKNAIFFVDEIHKKKGRSLSALFDLINLIKALDQTITVSGPFYLEQQSSSVSL
ncbi:phenylalanine--tRNA ligase beta subunit-related protein [Bacillus subtilis]|uniref:B3/B4 domain-containing protein n=1 Tax=Bacillus subtilis TaxID=1423 RepID=UPI00234AD6AE|nr:phenylalanine--tRNA ligase beta subunit-related protein [Bacillus subtilis]WCL62713.1 phenylalanine--tRNA ligase beta subunit-related protein [Bacillus subtilis]